MPIVIATKFNPKRLETAIQRKGFTAADLAFEMRRTSKLKTTESQVYKWIRGDHQPAGEAVFIAARVLEVTVESFYEADSTEEDEGRALLRDLRLLPRGEEMPDLLRRRIERFITPRSEVGS
ncbi:MAG: hypothetical protein ACJ76I_11955 [Gaiellaceae bacterium]